ncbi:hypothetical protein DFH06DRAFT_1329057 [Mycena polygramma]|nr:hypothetical protein DFH06DRAFT_1329057 [Mycena polygramma]
MSNHDPAFGSVPIPSTSSSENEITEDVIPGPWLELHRNTIGYTISLFRSSETGLQQLLTLSEQCSQRDMITSLANYRSVLDTVLKIVQNESGVDWDKQGLERHEIATRLSEGLKKDAANVIQQLEEARVGGLTQSFLDLIQTVG